MACPRVLAHGFVPTAACLRFVSGSGAWQYVALPAATVECCQPSPASWTGALEVLPNRRHDVLFLCIFCSFLCLFWLFRIELE